LGPLSTHDPFVWVLIGGSLVFWHLVELALGGRRSARGRNVSEWSYYCIMALMVASLVGSIMAADRSVATISGPPWWPVIGGITLIWAGLGFRVWAILTLGRFFKVMVVIQDDHRVVERGPYRWLRHPSYLGSIVAMTGVGLAEGDWASVAIMSLGTLAAFLIRIPVEERVLLTELGEEYAAYSRRTARLVPGLY
jgi:protein-S-isoprenylcysteine O-methyltransferase Ste14